MLDICSFVRVEPINYAGNSFIMNAIATMMIQIPLAPLKKDSAISLVALLARRY
ncbi:MAG: hypothetical protein WA902_13605 [Thermosynechococcaceae cyanobacterium]